MLSKGSSINKNINTIIKGQSEPKSSERPWLPNLVFKNWSIVIKNTHAVVDCRFWSKVFCWQDFSPETSLSSLQTETFWKLLTWQRNILQKCENALKKTLLNSWCVDTLVKLFGLKVSGIGLCLQILKWCPPCTKGGCILVMETFSKIDPERVQASTSSPRLTCDYFKHCKVPR